MKAFFHIAFFSLPFLAGAQPAFSPETFKALEAKIDSIMENHHIPGAQAMIISQDTILWTSNFGYADVENQVPVTDETMFRIGSVTKSFVAMSVMMLVENGKVSLNDRVGELIPEVPFENQWKDTHPVLVSHLMEHTTGFDDFHLVEYAQSADGWTTLEGLLFHSASRTSRWKPGQHASYCNSGPPMAAFIVEKKTGQPFEAFAQQRIFDPLGMEKTSLLYTDIVQKDLAKGYTGGKELKEAPYWHVLQRPAGSINSTASEMARYLSVYLNRGQFLQNQDTLRLLQPGSIERMEHPETTLAAKAGVRDGYGLHIGSRDFRGVRMYGHNGGMDGFLADMHYIPGLNLGFVFFINKSGTPGFNEIEKAILDVLIPEDNPAGSPSGIQADPSVAGYYRTATSRQELLRFIEWPFNVVRILNRDGQYFYQPLFSKSEPLEVEKPKVLRYTNKDGFSTRIVFGEDEDGKTFMQMPNFLANFYVASALAVWGSLVLIALCILLILSSILSGLIWIPIAIFGKTPVRNFNARFFPFLASVFFLSIMIPLAIAAGNDPINRLGNPTPWSVSIFIFSILFAGFSILALIATSRSFSPPMNKAARFHSFLVALACMATTAYLWYWGMIGVQMWA